MMTATAPSILEATLVHIAARNGNLHVYPQRAGDVVVYHVSDPPVATPARPHEVLWVVELADPGDRLGIQLQPVADPAGGRARDPFPGRPQTLECQGAGQHFLASGPPALGPGAGRQLECKYDVVWTRADGSVVRLDPVVIIKEDP